MKKMSRVIIALVAITLLGLNLVFAQETKTAPETEKKPAKKTRRPGARGRAAPISVEGCVGRGTERNCFTMTTAEGKVYSFQTPEAEKHMGHLVKITGRPVAGKSICTQGTFVSDIKIQHISPKCPF